MAKVLWKVHLRGAGWDERILSCGLDWRAWGGSSPKSELLSSFVQVPKEERCKTCEKVLVFLMKEGGYACVDPKACK